MYRHGARRLQDGRCRFSLWAPNCRDVAVELGSGARHTLHGREQGWFEADVDIADEIVDYRFVIDHQHQVPDPASRQQVTDVHGFSRLVDPDRYPWQHPHWQGRPWGETVLYELHVGLFGGFAQVENHLAHLAELGVTALQLMPLAAFAGERNWGYDGVLPFAPASCYGSPDELRHLIDSAHAFGLMVFIDVVYNHFGPEGNYLGLYAADFFRDDRITPWGGAVDLRRPQVRQFFCENALMWLQDYRADGLRLDAVHALNDDEFLLELAARVRAELPRGRHVHLVLENEHNNAALLSNGYDAQWNDDGHNTLHVLLTGEQESYYADYAEDPTGKLATCLQQGFVYQGQNNRHGRARGEPSGHLPPHAFVLFLQNHDQVGNRAFGERLIDIADTDALKAATTLLLLCPMVPLLFMGEEWGATRPFLFFTDYHDQLADAVREGRRNEFREFSRFTDEQMRQKIPDPNAPSSFTRSQPDLASALRPRQRQWLAFYKRLLQLRHQHIVPGIADSASLGAEVLGEGAVIARWRLGTGRTLCIALNLGHRPVQLPAMSEHAQLLHGQRINPNEYRQGLLPHNSALVTLEPCHE